jgi:palmitoyl-protein thioesterase
MLTNFKHQAKRGCKLINKKLDEWNLRNGFILFGSSQGNLIARYVIQACEAGQYVRRYISSGGPHMGVMRVPKTSDKGLGKLFNNLIIDVIYSPLIQWTIGPAGYFKSLKRYDTYLDKCIFLPDLNNERNYNEQYRQRMINLDQMVLMKYTKDSVIHPNESEHFGYYKDHTQTEIVKMEDTEGYKQDLIGLKTLNEANKIFFYESPHDHLRMTIEELKDLIFPHFG